MDSELLTCPSCGGEYLHHDGIEWFDRAEDAETGDHVSVNKLGVVVNHSLVGNPSPRRGGLFVTFWCEGCDRRARFELIQHKGQTFVELRAE